MREDLRHKFSKGLQQLEGEGYEDRQKESRQIERKVETESAKVHAYKLKAIEKDKNMRRGADRNREKEGFAGRKKQKVERER